jgi:ubiquitin C-terminal hydrolase
MFFTPVLRKYLYNIKHAESHVVCQELCTLFGILSESDSNVVLPKEFTRAFLKASNGGLRLGDQWDLNEVWTFMIDHLSQELKASSVQSDGPQLFFASNERQLLLQQIQDKASHVWQTTMKSVEQVWAIKTHGLLIGQIQCTSCKYTCHNIEPFTSISLPIRNQREPVSLNECFFDFFKTEVLDEWTCDKCKTKMQSEKLTRFWCASDLLAIHIKRYGYDAQGNGHSISTPLVIPDHFSITLGTEIGFEKQKEYILCAVGLHYGGLQGGHYIAMCRAVDGWVIIDDDRVQKLQDEALGSALGCNKHAYMLFYQRCHNKDKALI